MPVPSAGLRHLSPLSSAIIANRDVLPHPGSDCMTGVISVAIRGMILRSSLIETVSTVWTLAMIDYFLY